jgi:prevent-host-death family protein
MYTRVVSVEVGVRELRGRLRYWLDRVAAGEEVLVTDRGRPRARLIGAEQTTTLDRLIAEGVVTPPKRPKGSRPLPDPIPVRGSVTELLLEERRRGY